jgi:hypothetical protein
VSFHFLAENPKDSLARPFTMIRRENILQGRKEEHGSLSEKCENARSLEARGLNDRRIAWTLPALSAGIDANDHHGS